MRARTRARARASKAQDESEDFAVFCFETESRGVRLTLALGLGHVWRSPKLRRAFQGTRDFFGSYKGSMCRPRPHCLKLLCAQYKWIQVEEAKDFLGFGSEASVSDAEVVPADFCARRTRNGRAAGVPAAPIYARALAAAVDRTSVLSGCWQP